MSLALSQTLPFEAYKRLVEGFCTPMSVRDEARRCLQQFRQVWEPRKEREMDSFILVNEAREAEFQMSKLDFINQ